MERSTSPFRQCDSCGKPLGEGAIGRGEASMRGELMICRSCLMQEERGATLPINPPASRAALWHRRDEDAGDGLDTEPLPQTERLEDDTAPLEEEAPPRASHMRSKRKSLQRDPPNDEEQCDIVLADNTRLRGRLHRTSRGKLVIFEQPGSAQAIPAAQSKRSPSPGPSAKRAKLPQPKHKATASASLPSKRANPNPSSQALMVGQPVARAKSPLLAAAVLLLMIVVPAFAVSLYNMIQNSKVAEELKQQRDRAQMELEAQRAGRSPLRQELLDQAPYDGEQDAALDNEGSAPNESGEDDDSSAAPIPLSADAQRNLQNMRDSLARPLLTAAKLGSPELGTRLLSLREIGRVRATSAGRAVQQRLSSQEPVERQLAASVLGELSYRPARGALEDLAASDPDHSVRMAATRAAAKLGADVTAIELAEFTRGELQRLYDSISSLPGQDEAKALIQRELQSRDGGSE